ncbi:MAG: hypothetical protein L0I02_04065 [Lactobacillus sp.]|nr:hypothetical protein [Lactobacillus sp.]MDN6043317.1 hypothetical protein [Lactobacillus sp.]MDN6052353.1 hypothetical protein [Lactobacillus sp.]
MIYIACGSLLLAVGLLWLISPAKRPNRIYGYYSYLANTNTESFKYAQRWGANYFLLSGGMQLALGVLIHLLQWDRYFLGWLLTFYFFILLPFIWTEKRLKRFLIARSELPADYVDPDQVKRHKTKGFKD